MCACFKTARFVCVRVRGGQSREHMRPYAADNSTIQDNDNTLAVRRKRNSRGHTTTTQHMLFIEDKRKGRAKEHKTLTNYGAERYKMCVARMCGKEKLCRVCVCAAYKTYCRP